MNSTEQACEEIKRGGIIAYPTEAVFGIGCDPRNLEALHKLRNLKARAGYKGFIVICASIEQLLESFPELEIDAEQMTRLRAEQRHPTTWLINTKAPLSALLIGDNSTLAVRVTKHPLAKTLCQRAGPIVSTSANTEGEEPATSIKALQHCFKDQIDYYLDGPLGNAKTPSQIIKLDNGEITRSA